MIRFRVKLLLNVINPRSEIVNKMVSVLFFSICFLQTLTKDDWFLHPRRN